MNQPDAQTALNYVTCPCQHCSGNIEFDANQLDPVEKITVPCPHCELETVIFVPEQKVSPIISEVPIYEHNIVNGVLQKMNCEQEKFYRKLVNSIESKTYLSVESQEAYLNYYLWEKYKTFDKDSLERLYDELLCLAVPYGKVGRGIYWRPISWSYDCLLALESYEKYFEASKPANIFSTNTHFSNQKCNVRYFLGMKVSAVDLLQMYGELGKPITNFTKLHPKEFEKILEAIFTEQEKTSGPWFERILAESDRKDYQTHLFPCLHHFARRSKIPSYCFYGASDNLVKHLCDGFREAENRLRQKFGEKSVGEKWDGETKLFYEIKDAFPDAEVIHHGNPKWLGKQHLDVWMPGFRIGVEYHGIQHFQPMRHLGGEEHLIKQRERDLRKSKLCTMNGVELIVVTDETQIETVVGKIKERMANPIPFFEVQEIKSPVAETNTSRITRPDANKNPVEMSLAEIWLKLLDTVSLVSPFTRGYLNDGHPVSFERNIFTIGFAPEHKDHAMLLDSARTRTLIATKLSELGYLGVMIKFTKSDC